MVNGADRRCSDPWRQQLKEEQKCTCYLLMLSIYPIYLSYLSIEETTLVYSEWIMERTCICILIIFAKRVLWCAWLHYKTWFLGVERTQYCVWGKKYIKMLNHWHSSCHDTAFRYNVFCLCVFFITLCSFYYNGFVYQRICQHNKHREQLLLYIICMFTPLWVVPVH